MTFPTPGPAPYSSRRPLRRPLRLVPAALADERRHGPDVVVVDTDLAGTVRLVALRPLDTPDPDPETPEDLAW